MAPRTAMMAMVTETGMVSGWWGSCSSCSGSSMPSDILLWRPFGVIGMCSRLSHDLGRSVRWGLRRHGGSWLDAKSGSGGDRRYGSDAKGRDGAEVSLRSE